MPFVQNAPKNVGKEPKNEANTHNPVTDITIHWQTVHYDFICEILSMPHEFKLHMYVSSVELPGWTGDCHGTNSLVIKQQINSHLGSCFCDGS